MFDELGLTLTDEVNTVVKNNNYIWIVNGLNPGVIFSHITSCAMSRVFLLKQSWNIEDRRIGGEITKKYIDISLFFFFFYGKSQSYRPTCCLQGAEIVCCLYTVVKGEPSMRIIYLQVLSKVFRKTTFLFQIFHISILISF